MWNSIFFFALLFVASIKGSSVVWEDCGIPLTREIYFQGVTLSQTPINVTSSGSSISVHVDAYTQTVINTGTQVVLQVLKDGETYVNVGIGDLCSILQTQSQIDCPLSASKYSLSYIYTLPPLPSGSYTVKLVIYDYTNTEIGCLSVDTALTDLEDQKTCGYTSSLFAELLGTFFYVNNTIQLGPYGPGGQALSYPWGTFHSVTATSDILGNNQNFENYVWGLTGNLNKSVLGTTFTGTMVIGYLPNPSVSTGATLVQQGSFSFVMSPNTAAISPPYIFKSGTVNFNPLYSFPSGFSSPLALGNLNPFTIGVTSDLDFFTVTASKYWCTCDCPAVSSSDSQSGGDKIESGGGAVISHGRPKWETGTIVVAVVGGLLIIAVALLAYWLHKHPRHPTPIYDDNDLMDPQKPDYGAIAINEVFEDDEREFM